MLGGLKAFPLSLQHTLLGREKRVRTGKRTTTVSLLTRLLCCLLKIDPSYACMLLPVLPSIKSSLKPGDAEGAGEREERPFGSFVFCLSSLSSVGHRPQT